MGFYNSISDHYDDIFPLQPLQVSFILDPAEKHKEKRILDVGCGTGNLSMALSFHVREITGIDPDKAMLEKARGKAARAAGNINFLPCGMLELEKNFDPEYFDTLLCLGNTLVHLESEEEIFQFLVDAKKILKTGGKLIIQIINYDRILNHGIDGLPTIENDRIRFVRNYRYQGKNSLIEFETILTIKETMQEIRNAIFLYPLSKTTLTEMILKAGFSDLMFSGNFKRDALLEESIPLIIEAKA